MKIKPWLRKTLISIVGTVIGTILIDAFSPIQILSWILKQMKLFFTFSLPFKLWFCVLICVLIVALIIFVFLLFFYINKKIRLISNTKSPKEPILKKPDYVKKYTEQVFGAVLYRWIWIKVSNDIHPYHPDAIKPFCNPCKTQLVQNHGVNRYHCPECDRKYGVKDLNSVKSLIWAEVEKSWQEKSKKIEHH